MIPEARKIKVPSDSELAGLLQQADVAPLLLDRDGVLYRLSREGDGDLWDDRDAQAVRDMLASTSASWPDLDVDAAIADLYRAREEGSRPPDRP